MSIYTDYSSFRAAFAASPVTIANDGMETFHGFDHVVRPFTSWELAAVAGVTIDFTGGVNDTIAGLDEFHGYLSDPGAANGTPRWEIVRADPGGGLTRSGRVTFRLTAHGVTHFADQNPDLMSALLRNVHLYMRNIAAETVYWADLHRCAFAPHSFTPSFAVITT